MLQKTDWPPNYDQVRRERAARLRILHQDQRALAGAKAYYRTHPTEFIEDWCDTFDPRNAGTSKPTTMPFILFARQREFVEFLHACYLNDAPGLFEKSRDMGATWLCLSYSIWAFLFIEGATIGWGSRKAASVDKIGDMSSIFEKIRFQMRTVPRCFWPDGFSDDGMAYMKVHARSGNSITGESGDDIGRGGRTRIYFKDESAHYEHPEAIEAALGDTTRVQIDISSVNGLGNVFHRKREAGIEWAPGEQVQKGKTNVFVMDWSEHPDKTQSWYDEREAKAIDDGLLHVFRQEVDRNYAASVEGIVIPAEWVKSSIDAHVKLGFEVHKNDDCYAGLDVADGGGDRNALAIREGVTLRTVEQWGERDTGVTTRKAIDAASLYGRKGRRARVQYDSVGVGAGVKAESNRLTDDGAMPKHVTLTSWNAGAQVLQPDDRVIPHDDESPLNKEFYSNLKAQAWWQLRLRFERTHRAVVSNNPSMYSQDELISLPSDLPLLRTLQKELSQPTMSRGTRMKLVIDKQPEGTRSPNLADAVVMCYWPVDSMAYDVTMEWV
jgi:phage terminase large subunit